MTYLRNITKEGRKVNPGVGGGVISGSPEVSER